MGPFTTLATQLVEQCKELDAHLESQGISAKAPADGPAAFDGELLTELPSDVEKKRASVLFKAKQLADLVNNPKDLVMTTLYCFTDILCIQAISNFQLADHVPEHGETTFAAISKASGVQEDLVKRFIQMASLKHIFRQTGNDTVKHTAASRILRGSTLLRDEVGFVTDEMAFASAFFLQALEKYPNPENGATTEQNKTGFSVANNSSDPIYTELAKKPERIMRFGKCMTSLTSGAAFEISHFVNAFDWDSLAKRGATVIDVGGGHGNVARAVEAAHPGVKMIVQDLPPAVAAGNAHNATLPPEKRDNVQFQVHDFFTPQKVEADVYYLKWILHNWSDKYAVQILKNLSLGMKPGSKVILYEYVLTEVARPGIQSEYYRRMVDIVMMACFAGAERSVSHFISLFKQADPRFKFVEFGEQEGSALSTIVMELGEDNRVNGA